MELDKELIFKGPFSFGYNSINPSIFQQKENGAESAGVYLWTILSNKDGKYYIHYVGEATGIAGRQREHLINILGLNYGIWDAEKARQGESEMIWKGLWRDKDRKLINDVIPKYKEMHKAIVAYVGIIDIFFANTVEPTEKVDIKIQRQYENKRTHIEGCIGYNLRNNHKDLKLFYPDDNHIGHSKKIGQQLHITVEGNAKIMGLDPVIDI